MAQWLAATLVGFAASAAKADIAVDVTTTNSTGTTTNGMVVNEVNPQSTGTGVFKPFLRVQANNLERGYNTDAQNPPLDSKGGIWTHSLFYGQLVPVHLPGNPGSPLYFLFSLDINQINADGHNGNLLSLTQLQIYTAPSTVPLGQPDPAAFPTGDPEGNNAAQKGTFGLGTTMLRYNLDSLSTDRVDMNGTLNPGSGAGDYDFYVPVSFFGNALPSDYVYFYSSFGRTGGGDNAPFQSTDGFEEWATNLNPNVQPPVTNPVPAPPALVLGLVGVVGLFGKRAWARRRTPELA
jgi:hypothetical protein